MPPGTLRRTLFAAAVIAFVPCGVRATVVPRLDLATLARSSALIVQGHVVRHWSDWDPAHRFIWTHYLLAVADALKGRPGQTVVISEPGGSVGGARMAVSGVPEYSDGEEVVVFLERTPVGYWRCYGWRQGKYTVARSAGGVERIRANLSGMELAGAPGRRGRASVRLNRMDGLSLTEFKRLVRREAAK